MPIDWDAAREYYITHTKSTHAEIAEQFKCARETVSRKAKSEDWEGQRLQARHVRITKTREAVTTTEAEVSARHVKIAQALQSKALQALQKLDVDKLKPTEIREFLATATDIERKALGMDNKFTLRGVGDVAKLSDTDLLALARRAGIIGNGEAATLSA